MSKPYYGKFCSSFTLLDEVEKSLAFVKNIGIQTTKKGPYLSGRDGILVRCNRTQVQYTIQSYKLLPSSDFNSVAAYLMNGQPVVAILTRRRTFTQ